MKPDHPDNLDEIIDAALRSEAEHDVPFGFHRRTQERLQIAAMLDTEVANFRSSWAGALVTTALLTLAAGIAWFMIDIPDLLGRAVPGILGYYDHFLLLVIGNGATLGATSALLLLSAAIAHVALDRLLRSRAPRTDKT